MIQIASQPIVKSYVAHPLSRSFFISYFCYILILIIPATILINISCSWPDYKRALISPTLTYSSYQMSCYSNQDILYNTNIQSGIGKKNYLINMNVGIQGKKIRIEGQVTGTKVQACSAQIYFKSKIGSAVQVLSHLPLNIAITDPNFYLQSSNIRGVVYLKSSKPISQSSVVTVNQTEYGNYPFSFSGNFMEAGKKSIILHSKVFYQQNSVTAAALPFTFNAQFQILSESYFQQTSLIDKLRAFAPIFMYICLFVWWVVISPLISWMLKNRVYNARVHADKIKRQ